MAIYILHYGQKKKNPELIYVYIFCIYRYVHIHMKINIYEYI